MADENTTTQADGASEEWGMASFDARDGLEPGDRAVCPICRGEDPDCEDCLGTGVELTRDELANLNDERAERDWYWRTREKGA